jgi:hypothetical protein
LPVTIPGLALLSLSGAVLHLVPAAVAGALPFPPGLRLVLLGVIYAGAWVMGADAVAGEFAFDFGTTWAQGEPFRELFFRPVLTPTLLLAGLGLHLWHARQRGL